MPYQLEQFTWELTMRCDLRCKHCGSASGDPRPDELTCAEALDVARQLGKMGAKKGSLLGGEPLLRDDLPVIVEELHKNGIWVDIITNGTHLDHAMAHRLKQAGVGEITISIDGTQEVHDRIRCQGAYQKAMRAYDILRQAGIDSACNTTVSHENLDYLPRLRDDLVRNGVKMWQLQPCLPMGRAETGSFKKLSMEQIDRLIDFAIETNQNMHLSTIVSENIGYYSNKMQKMWQLVYGTDQVVQWKGCHAGIRSIGILSNGDVNGCVSIRSPQFVEGNLRREPLASIWNDPNRFRWRRQLRCEQLRGVCKNCQYAKHCLGGCPNTKLTICDDLYAEYPYCVYGAFLKERF